MKMLTTVKVTILLIAVAAMTTGPGVAFGANGYAEGFETSVDSWTSYSSTLGRVASGTDGIASPEGSYHMKVTAPTSGSTGAYTTLGGYSSDFGNGFTTSASVYIDLTDSGVATGDYGFDLSQAINGSDGNHAQDNIFHVGAVDINGTYEVLVNASQNSDASVNPYKLKNDQNGNYETIAESGWYTFEFDFAPNVANNSVDIGFTVYDGNGDEFWTGVGNHSNQYELADNDPNLVEVGGNRYMWFTFIEADSLAVDDVTQVPEPGSFLLLTLGGLGMLLFRRRGRR